MSSQDRSAPALLESYGNPHRLRSHISKTVLSTVHFGPPSETRTPRTDRCAKDHNGPSHISKMVPPTIHLGPPNWTKSRTFPLRFVLKL